jgi:hypothetical protein
MIKLSFVLSIAALSLFAADFWQGKPFAEWSDKDVHRMIESSPWAKAVSVPTGEPEGPQAGRAGKRGMASMGETRNPSDAASDPMNGPASGGRGRNQVEDAGGPIATATVVIRWQTAMPIKQALMKMKYGSEAGTSPESKKILDRHETIYVIAIIGVPETLMRGDGETLKKALVAQTALSVKGKDALKATDLQMGRSGRNLELYFLFPRTTEFTVDDKEVEFGTKLGNSQVKQKFRLKDMVFDGKLSL